MLDTYVHNTGLMFNSTAFDVKHYEVEVKLLRQVYRQILHCISVYHVGECYSCYSYLGFFILCSTVLGKCQGHLLALMRVSKLSTRCEKYNSTVFKCHVKQAWMF